jgi:hypothetical protein
VIRDLILTLTLLAVIFVAAHQPAPVKTVQVDYCVITYRAAGKDESGQWHFGWARGYGPCYLQDIYRNI